MQAIRTRVRAVALAWLLCQAASLAAFVPEHCCISHVAEAAAREHAAAKDDACHESEAPKPKPADTCPMDHGDGAACPMHSSKSTGGCAMSNACDGPGTHLASLFAYLGAIERPVTSTIVLASTPAFIPAPAVPLYQDITPDSPPPKA
jgi:hypothetical protein